LCPCLPHQLSPASPRSPSRSRSALTDRTLASQPTLSRLENAVDGKVCYRLARAPLEVYLREYAQPACPTHILLDTLRLRLLKIGGSVRQLLGGIRLHLANSHRGEPLWRLLVERPHRFVKNSGKPFLQVHLPKRPAICYGSARAVRSDGRTDPRRSPERASLDTP
jgi:hypothetical protein